MKHIGLFLLAIFLVPGAVAEVTYEQSVRVFQSAEHPDPVENLEELCNEAIEFFWFEPFDFEGVGPFDISVAAQIELHSVHTKKTTGEVKKPIKKVGEALVCQDWNTWALDPLVTSVPVFYLVNIDGMRLAAVGGVYSPLFQTTLGGGGQPMTPQSEILDLYYPAQGVFAANFSATILPSLPADNPYLPSDGTGGTIAVNSILDAAGLDDEFVSEGLWVIRFLEPVED